MSSVLHSTELHSTNDPKTHSTSTNETANQTRQRISKTNCVRTKKEQQSSQAIHNQSRSLIYLQCEQSRRQGTASFILHSLVLFLTAILRYIRPR